LIRAWGCCTVLPEQRTGTATSSADGIVAAAAVVDAVDAVDTGIAAVEVAAQMPLAFVFIL
jgi:hypothetical protein